MLKISPQPAGALLATGINNSKVIANNDRNNKNRPNPILQSVCAEWKNLVF